MSEAQCAPVTGFDDMSRIRTLNERYLSSAANLPISFVFDGSVVAGIPASWKPVSRRRRIDANIVETVYEGQAPRGGLTLRVECVEYTDYPVVEWTAWFRNAGSQPTPILSDIQALDATIEGESPVLWHCNGDFCSAEGYTAEESPLRDGRTLAFAPYGGRSCDSAFPYYRLMFEGGGLSLAIGWPAQWAASFRAVGGGVHARAGQERTHLRLMPGETIRSPRITVMAWTGDAARAANLWRRWYRDHLLPRTNGRSLGPLLAAHGTDEGEEFTAATETNQIRYIEKWRAHGIPIDVWWIDAGWYHCYNPRHERQWWYTGTWEPDPERFPKGLKPVSDCAAKNGVALLVWFEPERVAWGSRLLAEHPDWLLKDPAWFERTKTKNGLKPAEHEEILLNLGDPACRRWLTDHVCQLIQENGIKIYRQDHNFSAPLAHWRAHEPPDRQGINENLHVQGYLQYWDDLLARNPGLWIDSCASGGRRNDLETMRRSVPLHYSDFGYGDHPVKLSFHHVMFQWLPYFKESTLAWDQEEPTRFDRRVDSYAYHCGMGPMIMPCIDIRRDDYDFDLMKRMLAIWRRAAGFMLNGDYYPLTPIHRSPAHWVARQFDCPETGCGSIQGIRLAAAPDATITVYPQGILAGATYAFENMETNETKRVSGAALIRDGFTLALAARSGAIWFYSRTNSAGSSLPEHAWCR
ncbi:MAG: alpha-galactosidase [Kiritimatiellae bacterium]|nr:alpha-galactosidase [Kiritimatiellia bacterium]